MRVWIDQDLCTGDGICVDHCPDVFVQLEDGIAYVAEEGVVLNDPGGSGSLALVPSRRIADVIHAAEACPGECIFIEVDPPAAAPADPDPASEPDVLDPDVTVGYESPAASDDAAA